MKGLEQIRPAKTWGDVEAAIKIAVECGILIDKRADMPRGRDAQGYYIEWKRSRATPADVLGHCLHQNGSKNFTNPPRTAEYHTSKNNHITPGRPLPSGSYPIMIPDIDGPAWLTGNLDGITYAQGDNAAGDENRHLIPVLVMGGFEDSGFKRPWTKVGPSDHQNANLIMVVTWLQRVFDYGGEGYFGHYHFGKPTCPGRALRQWTEAARAGDDQANLLSDLDWQRALLRWDPQALPRFGADGDWGGESRCALTKFQKQRGIRQTAQQDPFTALVLLQRYPAPDEVLDMSDMGAVEISKFTDGELVQPQPPIEHIDIKVEMDPPDDEDDVVNPCGKGREDCPVTVEHGHCGDCDGAVTNDTVDGEAWNSEFGCLCLTCYEKRLARRWPSDDPEPVEQIDDPEDPPEE